MLSVYLHIPHCCSQVLLKQITELEGSGGHGARGGGGGQRGGVDPSLRENLSLFRLTADAMVKVVYSTCIPFGHLWIIIIATKVGS